MFRILAAGAGFLTVVVTARGFGVDGRGVYALTTLAVTLMLSILGGTSHALAAEFAHRRATSSQLYASSIVIAAAGGGAIALGALAVAAIGWPSLRPLAYAALALPSALFVDFALTLLLTEGEVRRMHYLHLLQYVLPLIGLAIVALVAPGHIYLALGVWVVAFIVLSLTAAVSEWWRVGLSFRGTRRLIVRLVRRGSRVSFGNGIAQLNYRIDLLVVAALLPLAQVGRYSVALALGEVLWLLSRSVMTGAYAAIMAAHADEESVRVTTRAFRHSLGMLTLAALLMGGVGSFFIRPIFGPEFAGVWLPLVLVLPGIVAYGVVEVFREFFVVRLERVREYIVMAGGSAIANLTLAFILIPPLGLAGAALSTSISYLAAALFLVTRFARVAGVKDVRAFLPGRSELTDYHRLYRSLAGRGQ
jgi:O-antigen/teichoic acid export membrane protein